MAATATPHCAVRPSKQRRYVPPKPDSELQTAYQRIFPVALRDVSSEDPDARRWDAIFAAHRHLVDASRWELAGDAAAFVVHVAVQSELSPDVRVRRAALACQLNLCIGRALYRPSARHDPAKLRDGAKQQSLWERAIQQHVGAVRGGGGASVLAVSDEFSVDAALRALGVEDTYAHGFAQDDGIVPCADLRRKASIAASSAHLRHAALGCSFGQAPHGVDFCHALHAAATALLITVMPQTAVGCSQHAQYVLENLPNGRQVAHAFAGRSAAMRTVPCVADLEYVLTAPSLLMAAGEAASRVEFRPLLLPALQDVAKRSGGAGKVGRFYAGSQALKRRGVQLSLIALRSYGTIGERTVGVAHDRDDDDELGATDVVVPIGAFPGRLLDPRESALASLLLATTAAVRHYTRRLAAGDVPHAAVGPVADQLPLLLNLLASWVGMSAVPSLHAGVFGQLVRAVEDVVCVAGRPSCGLLRGVMLLMLRIAVDMDPADPARLPTAAALDIAATASGGDRQSDRPRTLATAMLLALSQAHRRPAPRLRWVEATRIMCMHAAATKEPGSTEDAAFRMLGRLRTSVATAAGTWETAMRVVCGLITQSRRRALTNEPRRSGAVAEGIANVALRDSRTTWLAALTAVSLVLTSSPQADGGRPTVDGGTAHSCALALCRLIQGPAVAEAWGTLQSNGVPLDEVTGLPMLLAAANAGDAASVEVMLRSAVASKPAPVDSGGAALPAPVLAAEPLLETMAQLHRCGQWGDALALVRRLGQEGRVSSDVELLSFVLITALNHDPHPLAAAIAAHLAAAGGASTVALEFLLRLCERCPTRGYDHILLHTMLQAALCVSPAIIELAEAHHKVLEAARDSDNNASRPARTPASAVAVVADVTVEVLDALGGVGLTPVAELPQGKVAVAQHTAPAVESLLVALSESLRPRGFSGQLMQSFKRALYGIAELEYVLVPPHWIRRSVNAANGLTVVPRHFVTTRR